jgi:hypothetical protein
MEEAYTLGSVMLTRTVTKNITQTPNASLHPRRRLAEV